MSTLKADTIQSTGGGAVTLTKQAAAKVTFNMNLRSSTTMDIATNAISTECLNISSGTDAGTGLARGNLTNAMQNKQYIWTEGTLAANNTHNLDVGVATTSLIPFQGHDADSGSDSDLIGCSAVFGDLA
jgi:hypothetical protein